MEAERVSFADQVRAAARRLGFDAVGIARATLGVDQDFARYQAFLGKGMHGEMGWLADHPAVRARLDGDGILPGAKSVVCVARRYPKGPPHQDMRERAAGLDTAQAIARYARGQDYHRFVRRRLRRLAAFVRSLGTDAPPVRARPICDREPVLERAWAARAGLGFIGKNGLLIVPGLGSMVLLGEVVTTLELDVDSPIQERCGSCTRCLDACPTRAFPSAFVLDPRRCVSYLTIEHRKPIPLDLREGVGTHLFGCDDCQTVCPFNASAGTRAERGTREEETREGVSRVPSEATKSDPFAPLERWSRLRIESLLSLDQQAWDALSRGTPLKRAGRACIARNAAIVLGNRGDPSALPALRAAACNHDDPMVREAASWAASRLQARED
jgi:epoxyqueuosine reductase